MGLEWTHVSRDCVSDGAPLLEFAEIRSTRVRSIPLDPAITIAGSVIVSPDSPSSTTEYVVTAFRDDAAS